MDESTKVFVYTEGAVVPKDVLRVRVHPSVTVIPEHAFQDRVKLIEIDLCEGLLEIGSCAFKNCVVLKKITVPSTVTVISNQAFDKCAQLEVVELCEGLLEIGKDAFTRCEALKEITIPSTVTVIDDYAFAFCRQLEQVTLFEGLQQIGTFAFKCCFVLKNITIPTTVTRIEKSTFNHSLLCNPRLHDGIDNIEEGAFYGGNFPTLRIPPLVTTLEHEMFYDCIGMISLELPEYISLIGKDAFSYCHSLRNVALPLDVEFPASRLTRFDHCTDLFHLFSTEDQLIDALKHRFDELPIHKRIYYLSYNDQSVAVGGIRVTLADQLNNATNMYEQYQLKVNPSGKQQDCLGMTPLHILACSTLQDIELYKVLINKYPETLIIKDRWRALPLLYAVWGNAPTDILRFLLQSYKSFYPNHELDWTDMVVTLGKVDVPSDIIQNLIDLQQEFFPDHKIDWSIVLAESVLEPEDESDYQPWTDDNPCVPWGESFRNLLLFSFSDRIKAIGLRQWREHLIDEYIEKHHLARSGHVGERRALINAIRGKVAKFETDYARLKEATTVLELAMWKHKMNDQIQEKTNQSNKKMKIEASDLREQCRISGGADIIVEHMLPFLTTLPKGEPTAEDINVRFIPLERELPFSVRWTAHYTRTQEDVGHLSD